MKNKYAAYCAKCDYLVVTGAGTVIWDGIDWITTHVQCPDVAALEAKRKRERELDAYVEEIRKAVLADSKCVAYARSKGIRL